MYKYGWDACLLYKNSFYAAYTNCVHAHVSDRTNIHWNYYIQPNNYSKYIIIYWSTFFMGIKYPNFNESKIDHVHGKGFFQVQSWCVTCDHPDLTDCQSGMVGIHSCQNNDRKTSLNKNMLLSSGMCPVPTANLSILKLLCGTASQQLTSGNSSLILICLNHVTM